MAEEESTSLDAVAAAIRTSPPPKAPKAEPAAAAQPEANDDLMGDDEDIDLSQPEAQADEEQGEEQAEEGAEEEETSEEDIDIDEIPIEVTVEGETKEVTLKDLKANYSGNQAIEKRLQEATEVRQQVYQQGQTLYQALGAVSQKLQHLDQIIAQSAQPDIDWDTLRATDPARYLLERDKAQIAEGRRNAVRQQAYMAQQEQAALEQQYAIELAKEQASNLLKELPELRDPQKGAAIMKGMVDVAAKYGYDFEEVRSVMDSRALKILARLSELEAGAAKKVTPLTPKVPRPLSKPGSRPAGQPMSELKKAQLSALKRARSTGKVDDVAALLLTRKK